LFVYDLSYYVGDLFQIIFI